MSVFKRLFHDAEPLCPECGEELYLGTCINCEVKARVEEERRARKRFVNELADEVERRLATPNT